MAEACAAAALTPCGTPVVAVSIEPLTLAAGKPVIAVPGESPTSPDITEVGTLVIVVPAITAYGVAAPRSMLVAATALSLAKAMSVIKLSKPTPNVPRPRRARERLAERWVGLRNIENFDGEE